MILKWQKTKHSSQLIYIHILNADIYKYISIQQIYVFEEIFLLHSNLPLVVWEKMAILGFEVIGPKIKTGFIFHAVTVKGQ